MATALESVRARILEMEAPLVTASADLRPAGPGAVPAALTVVPHALAEVAEVYEPKREDVTRSLEQIARRCRRRSGRRLRRGRGLLYVGCAAEEIGLGIATPLPFRNNARIGQRPWLLELERYRYLLSRPVTLVATDLHTADIIRIREGEDVGRTRFRRSPGGRGWRTIRGSRWAAAEPSMGR